MRSINFTFDEFLRAKVHNKIEGPIVGAVIWAVGIIMSLYIYFIVLELARRVLPKQPSIEMV